MTTPVTPGPPPPQRCHSPRSRRSRCKPSGPLGKPWNRAGARAVFVLIGGPPTSLCEQGGCGCPRAPFTDALAARHDDRSSFTDAPSAIIDARCPTTDPREQGPPRPQQGGRPSWHPIHAIRLMFAKCVISKNLLRKEVGLCYHALWIIVASSPREDRCARLGAKTTGRQVQMEPFDHR